MQNTMLARTLVAGGIAAAGLTVGGIAMANAETGTATLPPGTAGHVVSFEDGRGHGAGMKDQMSEELAAELDVDEEEVAAALEAVHDDVRPEKPGTGDGEAPTPPTDAERAERQKTLAAALAKELGISTAEVTAALDAIHEDVRAEEREALVERIQTAVDDGDLTAADKASVLKAFDARVLGGGPGGFHHRIG